MKYHPPFENNARKMRISFLQLLHFPLFSFPCQTPSSDAFPAQTALYQPVSQTSAAFTGTFERTQQPSCCPRWGNLFATAAVSKALGGCSNPWLTSMVLTGDAGGRGRGHWQISQYAEEEKNCYIVWEAKHESFRPSTCFSLPEFRSSTKPNQKFMVKPTSAFLKWGQFWGAQTHFPFEFICPRTQDQTDKRGRRDHIFHRIPSSENRDKQRCSAAKSHLKKKPKPCKSLKWKQ